MACSAPLLKKQEIRRAGCRDARGFTSHTEAEACRPLLLQNQFVVSGHEKPVSLTFVDDPHFPSPGKKLGRIDRLGSRAAITRPATDTWHLGRRFRARLDSQAALTEPQLFAFDNRPFLRIVWGSHDTPVQVHLASAACGDRCVSNLAGLRQKVGLAGCESKGRH